MHHTAESNSAVRSHRGVKWWKVLQNICSVCHTAESITYQVSVFIRSFTNAISLWCLKIFIRNWYGQSQIVQGISFTSKVFWKIEVERCSKYKNKKNGHFRISLAPRCASHCGVKVTKFIKKLCGVHPTAESDSMMRFPPRSQTPRCASHRWVKLRGGLPTTESSSAVCITPRSQMLTTESKTKSLRDSGCL